MTDQQTVGAVLAILLVVLGSMIWVSIPKDEDEE